MLFILGLTLGVSSQDRRITIWLGLITLGIGFISVILYFIVPVKYEEKEIGWLSKLLEYLILIIMVLLIIAIAAPGYMGSNTRANVQNTRNDLKNIEGSLVKYFMANKKYPISDLSILTTPVAYIDNLGKNPFSKTQPYKYNSDGMLWILYATGPDKKYEINENAMVDLKMKGSGILIPLTYDPTNGSVSRGDIWMTNYK